MTTIYQDSSRLSLMLVWYSYNKAPLTYNRLILVYDLHDYFLTSTGLWTCTKTSRSPHALWWFMKTYQEFPSVTKTCCSSSLYILHDWPRLTGHRWSYRGRIWSKIRCDPGFNDQSGEGCKNQWELITLALTAGVWWVVSSVSIQLVGITE